MPLYETAAYKIYKSKKPNKKYVAYLTKPNINGRSAIHFGDTRYEQYYDKIGLYKKLDHLNSERRARYYARHSKDYPKYTSDWFSKHFLW